MNQKQMKFKKWVNPFTRKSIMINHKILNKLIVIKVNTQVPVCIIRRTVQVSSKILNSVQLNVKISLINFKKA